MPPALIALVTKPPSPVPWWPAVTISAAALLFTVASFWWLNARQGRLRCFEPHSFAALARTNGIRLRIPLALYNTGAKPIIVQDLRLTFPDHPRGLPSFPWRNTRRSVQPTSDDVQDLPAVFSIAGRTATETFIEFGGPWRGFEPTPAVHRVRVDARLGHKRGWGPLLRFDLRLGNVLHPSRYIAYSNNDDALSDEDKRKAKDALNELLTQLRNSSDP